MKLFDKLKKHNNDYPELDLNSTDLHLTCSVVIPSYNSANTIGIVIKRLLEQTAIDQLNEIIIVDDNSGDDTEMIIKNINTDATDILYIKNTTQMFSGQCRNIGLEKATGDIIFFLDSDIAVPNTFIEKHIQLHQLIDSCFSFSFRSYIPEAVFQTEDFIFPINEYNKEFRLEKTIPLAWCESEEQKKWANKQIKLYEITNGFRHLSSVNREYFWTLPEVALIGISAIKRKHIERVGGFESDFKGWGYEDIAFAAKLIGSGLFAIPILETGTYHPDHPHRIPDHGEWFKKNKELYYKFLNT